MVGCLQVWSSTCHNCKDGCICTTGNYDEPVVNPECQVTGHWDVVTQVNPKPYTLNPQPSTLNQPTLNPKP